MAQMWAPYGTAFSFRAPVLKVNSPNFAFAADWPTYVATSVAVFKDGATIANITTPPTNVSGGVWSWSLTAAEMSASEIIVQVVDRAVLTDQMFRIITLPDGAVRSRLAQGGTVNTIQLDTGAAALDSIYVGSVVSIIAGTGVGQSRIITAYAQSTKTCTVDTNWAVNPTSSSVYAIYSSAYGITQAQTQTAATAALTAYGTSTLTQAQAQSATNTALTAFGTSTLTQAQSQTAATAALTAYGPSTLTAGQVTAAVPTTAQIATEIFDTQTVESGMSFRGALRLISSVLMGRRSGTGSGTEVFNAAVTNAKARVTATIDNNGNRTSVTTDQT